MNTDLEYMKSQVLREVGDADTQIQNWHRDTVLEKSQKEADFFEQETDYMVEQEESAKRTEAQGVEVAGIFESIQSGIEDEKISSKFKSAVFDKSRRAKFGGETEVGVARSLKTAKSFYADMLNYKNISEDFSDVVGDDNGRTIEAKTAMAREGLKRTFKENFGATDQEAEDYVTSNFGDFERDPTVWDRLKQVPGDIGKQVMTEFDRAGILLSAPVQGALKSGLVGTMSTDQFMEQYPRLATGMAAVTLALGNENATDKEKKEAKTLGKNLAKTFNSIVRTAMTVKSGSDQALKELGRAFRGEAPSDELLDEFAKEAAKGNKSAETWIKRILPWAEPAAAIGIELKAAKMARKVPDYFFKETWQGFFYDIFLPGRVSSWQMGAVSVNATAASIDRVTKVEAASGNINTPAQKAHLEKWFLSWVKSDPDPAIARYHQQWLDTGEMPDSATLLKLKTADDIKNNNFTDTTTREAARQVVKQIRESDAATTADLDNATALESKVQQADAQAAQDSGKSAPAPVKLTEADPAVVAEKLKDLNVVWTDDNSDLGRVRKSPDTGETEIFVQKDLTLDTFINNAMTVSLQKLGYTDELLKRLVTTDDEAKLFVALHEEGHKRAGDLDFDMTGLSKGPNRNVQILEQEELAMHHALNQFARVTGKPYHDVVATNISPGSYTWVNPENGLLSFRAIPKPDMTPTKVDPELDVFFTYLGTAKGVRAANKKIAAMTEASGKGVKYEPGLNTATGEMEEMIALVDYNELGEVFRLQPVMKPNGEMETPFEFSQRVNNAFAWRYGATNTEMANGTKRFYDSSTELAKTYSKAQMDKIAEIVNTWRGLKDMNKRAQGTAHEQAVADLMLQFRSDVANGGKSYRLLQAFTESLNRGAKGRSTGVVWKTSDQGDVNIGHLDVDGLMTRSVAQGPARGEATTITPEELSKSTGQVFPDQRAPLGAGSTRTAVDAPGSDPGVPQTFWDAKSHGAEGDATAVRSDDAMANARSLDDILRRDDSGMVQEGEVSRDGIARARKEDLEAQRMPGDEGPVTSQARSMVGSPEQVRVLELEEFAGVGTTSSPTAGGKINIFHANADDLEGSFRSVLAGPEGDAQYQVFMDRLVNGQIADMAKKISVDGADETEMLLFHRALASAKAMKEVKSTGSVSASTRAWLDDMDLRVGAEGDTVETAILSGLEAASNRYGFAFNMQQKGQKVVDTQMAVLFNAIEDPKGRTRFVDRYASIMSGEDAVRARRALNKHRKRLTELVGGPCL